MLRDSDVTTKNARNKNQIDSLEWIRWLSNSSIKLLTFLFSLSVRVLPLNLCCLRGDGITKSPAVNQRARVMGSVVGVDGNIVTELYYSPWNGALVKCIVEISICNKRGYLFLFRSRSLFCRRNKYVPAENGSTSGENS